jgi:hypothetical protein
LHAFEAVRLIQLGSLYAAELDDVAEDGLVFVRHELDRVVFRFAGGLACADLEAAVGVGLVDNQIRQVALRCALCFAVEGGVALGGNVDEVEMSVACAGDRSGQQQRQAERPQNRQHDSVHGEEK